MLSNNEEGRKAEIRLKKRKKEDRKRKRGRERFIMKTTVGKRWNKR